MKSLGFILVLVCLSVVNGQPRVRRVLKEFVFEFGKRHEHMEHLKTVRGKNDLLLEEHVKLNLPPNAIDLYKKVTVITRHQPHVKYDPLRKKMIINFGVDKPPVSTYQIEVYGEYRKSEAAPPPRRLFRSADFEAGVNNKVKYYSNGEFDEAAVDFLGSNNK